MQQHPEIKQIFVDITQALTGEKLRELNARVDEDGASPETVAREFLEEENLLN